MAPNAFTDPDETAERWVDVRMTDPDEGEWDVDVVVAGNRVEYVDLRVREDLVAGFVDCLLADVSDDRTAEVLRRLADRQGVALAGNAADADADSDVDSDPTAVDDGTGDQN